MTAKSTKQKVIAGPKSTTDNVTDEVKTNPKLSGKRVKVRALQRGYYGHIIEEDEIFYVDSVYIPAKGKSTWFEVVGAKPAADEDEDDLA